MALRPDPSCHCQAFPAIPMERHTQYLFHLLSFQNHLPVFVSSYEHFALGVEKLTPVIEAIRDLFPENVSMMKRWLVLAGVFLVIMLYARILTWLSRRRQKKMWPQKTIQLLKREKLKHVRKMKVLEGQLRNQWLRHQKPDEFMK